MCEKQKKFVTSKYVNKKQTQDFVNETDSLNIF